MGLGIHGGFIATNPHSYVDFAAEAPWAIYRDLGRWLTEPNPLVFGVVMLTFETVTAALILSRGRYVRWGLTGAIVFLIGITPLGLQEVPNVILAAGMASLATRKFPTDVWTMLRRHRRRKLTTAALVASPPRIHAPDPRVTPGQPEPGLLRSGVSPLPQPSRIPWTY